VLFGGCDDRDNTDPTSSPTAASTTPGDIGPFDQTVAFADSQGMTYVLDVATSAMYVIGAEYGSLRWLDDRTLYTNLASRIILDRDEPPHSGSVPTAEPRSDPPGVSADGLWKVVPTDAGLLALQSTADGERLDIPGTSGPSKHAWSPAGHLLAIAVGGDCADDRLLFVDPDTDRIEQLTLDSDSVKDFLWHPNANAIATSLVTMVGSSGRYEAVLLSTDGTRTLLAPNDPSVRLRDDIVLQAWNPSGTRLLFSLNYGRKC